jgi:hypothetical protein
MAWRGVIKERGLDNMNANGEILTSFCAAHGLIITTTMFQLQHMVATKVKPLEPAGLNDCQEKRRQRNSKHKSMRERRLRQASPNAGIQDESPQV